MRNKTVISARFESVFIASTVSMVSAYILILTDNVVAGQVVGADAVAAMTLVFPLFTFLLFVSYIIADGLVMMASYAQGREDREEVNRLFSLGIILSVSSGIFFFAAGLLFKDEILSFWEISDQLTNFAGDYYDGLIFLSPIIFANIFIYTIFMAEGLENVCVKASVVAFVVNVSLDIILCRLIGITGIGLATTSGTLASLIVQIYFIASGQTQLHFKKYWSLKKTLQGILYSFYHSVDTLCISILPVLLSVATIENFGEERVIIVTVAVNLITLIIAIYTGLVDCLQPMICQYHAEKNLHSVKKTMSLGIKATVALSLIMTFAGIIFADFLPAMFGVEDETLANEAAEAMKFFLPFTTFLGVTLIYANYYIYIEEMNFGAVVKIILLSVMPFVGMKIGGNFSVNIFWLCVGSSFAVSFALNFVAVKFFGRRNNLLLIDKNILNRQLSYDINTNFDEVMNLTRRAEKDLSVLGIDCKIRDEIILLIEKIGLHAVERAGEKIFRLEVSILLDEGITLIIRDNGEPCDIIKSADEKNFNFREIFTEGTTSNIVDKNYLASGDENRLILKFERRSENV